MNSFQEVRALALVSLMVMVFACGKDGPVGPIAEQASETGLAKVASNAAGSNGAVVDVRVVREGTPVAGVELAFARSISGRQVEYRWKETTDEEGWTEIRISADDPQFWRGGASGYYLARAVDPISGEVVGQWGSIPIDRGKGNFFLLPVGTGFQPYPASMKDRGSYTLEADPDSLVSYGGGGGIFVLSMTPDLNFEGQVVLSLVADPRVHADLSAGILTQDRGISEVTIRPDTFITRSIVKIEILATHRDVTDTLQLSVSFLAQGVPGFSPQEGHTSTRVALDEFLSWLQTSHPEWGVETGQAWFAYNAAPSGWNGELLVGGTTWVFLSQRWQVTVRWAPMLPTWYLLRKRGEGKARLAAKRDWASGEIAEVPVPEFYIGP